MAGKAGRSGPRPGVPQRNGTAVTRLTLGALPATMRRQLASARKYRRSLEALVVEAKGAVDATDAHLIDEATGAEVHASVCRWLLRTRLEKMSVADIAKCSAEIMKARAARNRAVERLGIRDADDVLEALYRPVGSTPVEPLRVPAADDSGGNLEDK